MGGSMMSGLGGMGGVTGNSNVQQLMGTGNATPSPTPTPTTTPTASTPVGQFADNSTQPAYQGATPFDVNAAAKAAVPGTNFMGMPDWFQSMVDAKGGAWGTGEVALPAGANIPPPPNMAVSSIAKASQPKPVAKPGAPATPGAPAAPGAATPPPLVAPTPGGAQHPWDPRYGAAPTIAGMTPQQAEQAYGGNAAHYINPNIYQPDVLNWMRWNLGEQGYNQGLQREAGLRQNTGGYNS